MRFPLPRFGVGIERNIVEALDNGRGYIEVYLFHRETRRSVKIVVEKAEEGVSKLRIDAPEYSVFRGEIVRETLNFHELGLVLKSEELPTDLYQKLLDADRESKNSMKLKRDSKKKRNNWNTREKPNRLMTNYDGSNLLNGNGNGVNRELDDEEALRLLESDKDYIMMTHNGKVFSRNGRTY
jgi:hypothetical protein